MGREGETEQSGGKWKGNGKVKQRKRMEGKWKGETEKSGGKWKGNGKV